MPFIPHTAADKEQMLNFLQINSVKNLFSEIPSSLQQDFLHDFLPGLTEQEITVLMKKKAAQDVNQLNFIGAGAYEHFIPAAVWQLATRGELLTAYTPYQPEASQGTLQIIYEYQSMMANIMALDVSNASLYDGATAVAEAVLMAVRCQPEAAKKILIPKTLHPSYLAVIKTIIGAQKIAIEEIDFDAATGTIMAENLAQHKDFAALVIPQPNFFGLLEDVDLLTNYAHQNNALAIAQVNPIAMNLLKAPGQWGEHGVDIACGDGQPLGIPLSSGGPYFGFICCKKQFIRQMPGRIVGRTLDRHHNTGFVLTLQAREQHIRRSKATSNICTNQGLMVTAATIFMTLVGAYGLKQMAIKSQRNLQLFLQCVLKVKSVKLKFTTNNNWIATAAEQPRNDGSANFHEVVLELPCPAQKVIEYFSQHNIQAGLDLGVFYPHLKNCLLVCVTETKNIDDFELYTKLLGEVWH